MLALLFLPAPSLVESAAAIALDPAVRLQAAVGTDNNPLEVFNDATPNSRDPVTDEFVRLQVEGELTRRSTGLFQWMGLSVRGFSERYNEVQAEQRNQGEVRAIADLRLGPRGPALRLSGGWRGRDYPDSTARNFSRRWASANGRFRLGANGVLRPGVALWSLDFNLTGDRDQLGLDVDVIYEHSFRPWLTGHAGFGFGSVDYRRESLKVRYSPEGELQPELGPDQEDSSRSVRAGAQIVRGVLVQLDYTLRGQTSNSFGSNYRRNELRWLISRALPYQFSGQFFGNVESTHYTDPDLDKVFVLRAGEEQEAGDDNNLVALQMSRPLGQGWRAFLRHSWFENQSLFVGTFYSKRVWTLGLSWESPGFSGF